MNRRSIATSECSFHPGAYQRQRCDCPRKSQRELLLTSLLSPDNPLEELFTPGEWSAIGKALDLSQRELAVTILLAKGIKRQAIGQHLHKADGSCVSADTVRVYIDRVFRKARVENLQGLTLRLARVYLLLNGRRQRRAEDSEPVSEKAPQCRTIV
jgi:ATP/maltotriose-dependent transcriptional regulator MalT